MYNIKIIIRKKIVFNKLNKNKISNNLICAIKLKNKSNLI